MTNSGSDRATDLKLRPGRVEDAEPCGRICYEAFGLITSAHGFPHYFASEETVIKQMQASLSGTDVYSVVAEQNGQIVGSNFLRVNGPVGGVGPITVLPYKQNAKAGRRLMEDVITRAMDMDLKSLRLVQAAYHNRSLSLYTKLGFDVMEPLALMQGTSLNLRIEGYAVRTAGVDDIPLCNELHYRLHGYQRSKDLEAAVSEGMAFVVEHDARITGYASSIGFSGYAIGESNEELKALIAAAQSFAGPGFLLPTRNSQLFRWCLEHGLLVVEPANLMSMGMYKQPAGAFLPSILF